MFEINRNKKLKIHYCHTIPFVPFYLLLLTVRVRVRVRVRGFALDIQDLRLGLEGLHWIYRICG